MPRSIIGNIVWRVILLPVALLPLVFTGAGVYTMLRQHRCVSTYHAVPARVISSSMHVSRGKSTSYRPDIEYQYEVGGRTYVSKQVTPINMSSGRKWAEEILSQFPAGKMTVAYYDPRDPSDAILAKKYVFLPYFFILFSMPFVFIFTFGVGGAMLMKWGPKPPMRVGSRFELRPEERLTATWKVGAGAMVLWYGVGVMALVHYLVVARPVDAWFAGISFGVYALVGLIPLPGARKAYRLSQRMETPRVTIEQEDARPGDEIEVEIEQRLEEPAPERIGVGLVCRYTTRRNKRNITETLHEKIDPVAESPRGRSLFRTKTKVRVPPDGVKSREGATSFQWHVVVVTEYADGLKDQAKFPVTVRG